MNRYVTRPAAARPRELPDFVKLHEVDLGELVEAVHARCRQSATGDGGVDDAPAAGQATVVADQARLTQAMVNLATNAVVHTLDGAEIGLGASGAPGCGRAVRDTGAGVDLGDARPCSFDRAYRGPSSRACRPGRHRRSGLSIVAAIAEAHRRTARVELASPSGARFVIAILTALTRPTRR